MHVAFFLSSLRGGGAERVTLTISKALALQNSRIDLVVVRAEGELLPDLPTEVSLINLNARRVLTSSIALLRYLKLHKPDVLITVLPHVSVIALVICRLAGLKVPIIVSEHNTLSHSIANSITARGRFLHIPMKFTYPWATRILAVSHGVADDLSKVLSIPRSDISVIYNPVIDERFFELCQSEPNHRWYHSDGPPIIIGAGRLTKAKDFLTLIRAFSIAHTTTPLRLLILGEGEDRPQLTSLIQQLNLESVVDLPGFLDNPYPLISKARIFVLSSLWEGLPTVLIEALACKTSIISTDCQSGPREILKNGEFGVLVPINDHIVLAQQIVHLLKKPSSIPPDSAWKEFSTRNIVTQYQAVISSCKQ